jgi:putative ABC transport system permease protein
MPAPQLLATFTLAIGLAAATAIYAVIDAVLLRDLPYPHAERLVQIRERAEDGHDMALAYPNYADLSSTVDAFDATAYYTDMGAPVTYAGNTQRHRYALVGDNFFQVLGVAPCSGAAFPATSARAWP